MLKNSSFIRVRYADTDKMRIVYNGKYFEYFEVGRTEMLREIGLPYSQIENLGYLLPVLECSAKFIKPAIYDDLLRVETEMRQMPYPFLDLFYKVYNSENNILLTEGFTKHIFTKSSTNKPVKPFTEFNELIKKYF